MDLNAAMIIANKNISQSVLVILYSIILFYIILLGSLGFGNFVYGYYSIDINVYLLIITTFIIFFPGYVYGQIAMFRRIIRKERISFNLLTDMIIINSLLSLPITLIKLLIMFMLSIPSIVIYIYMNLNLITGILILTNLFLASFIAEYLFIYVYYKKIAIKKSLIASLKEGLLISLQLQNLFKTLPIFFIYYVFQFIQLIPIINIIFVLWLPILHIFTTGKVLMISDSK